MCFSRFDVLQAVMDDRVRITSCLFWHSAFQLSFKAQTEEKDASVLLI